MDQIKFDRPGTRKCPFCAEIIQAAAIKCRFCGEFLDNPKAHAPAPADSASPPAAAAPVPGQVLYSGRCSLIAMTGLAGKAFAILVIAAILIFVPIEKNLVKIVGNSLADKQVQLHSVRIMAGVGLAAAALAVLVIKGLAVRSVRYEVTCDRIEWARGIFTRKVDNLDMFRIVDIKLYQSFLDRLLNLGTVSLETTDKSTPTFDFIKVPHPRQLYDIIKKASLDADQKRTVVHLE
jgi:membrane protein YdbS with pleckstrin-like domain